MGLHNHKGAQGGYWGEGLDRPRRVEPGVTSARTLLTRDATIMVRATKRSTEWGTKCCVFGLAGTCVYYIARHHRPKVCGTHVASALHSLATNHHARVHHLLRH